MKLGMDRTVSIGDSFACIDRPRVVYTVAAHLESRPGMPPHARLVSDARSGSQPMLMSFSALLDRRFFARVSE
jgi:hypothetical protein